MKYLALALCIALPVICFGQKPGRSKPDSLLLGLAGVWQGKGTSFGIEVEDKASFDTVIKSGFLFMKLFSVKGDDFVAEGYLWYNPENEVIEFYEFNNGAWPVRMLKGNAEANKIALEENTDSRHIRITFVINKDSFDLEEAKLEDGKAEVFVKEKFSRVRN
jgi:hypothetical protein